MSLPKMGLFCVVTLIFVTINSVVSLKIYGANSPHLFSIPVQPRQAHPTSEWNAAQSIADIINSWRRQLADQPGNNGRRRRPESSTNTSTSTATTVTTTTTVPDRSSNPPFDPFEYLRQRQQARQWTPTNDGLAGKFVSAAASAAAGSVAASGGVDGPPAKLQLPTGAVQYSPIIPQQTNSATLASALLEQFARAKAEKETSELSDSASGATPLGFSRLGSGIGNPFANPSPQTKQNDNSGQSSKTEETDDESIEETSNTQSKSVESGSKEKTTSDQSGSQSQSRESPENQETAESHSSAKSQESVESRETMESRERSDETEENTKEDSRKAAEDTQTPPELSADQLARRAAGIAGAAINTGLAFGQRLADAAESQQRSAPQTRPDQQSQQPPQQPTPDKPTEPPQPRQPEKIKSENDYQPSSVENSEEESQQRSFFENSEMTNPSSAETNSETENLRSSERKSEPAGNQREFFEKSERENPSSPEQDSAQQPERAIAEMYSASGDAGDSGARRGLSALPVHSEPPVQKSGSSPELKLPPIPPEPAPAGLHSQPLLLSSMDGSASVERQAYVPTINEYDRNRDPNESVLETIVSPSPAPRQRLSNLMPNWVLERMQQSNRRPLAATVEPAQSPPPTDTSEDETSDDKDLEDKCVIKPPVGPCVRQSMYNVIKPTVAISMYDAMVSFVNPFTGKPLLDVDKATGKCTSLQCQACALKFKEIVHRQVASDEQLLRDFSEALYRLNASRVPPYAKCFELDTAPRHNRRTVLTEAQRSASACVANQLRFAQSNLSSPIMYPEGHARQRRQAAQPGQDRSVELRCVKKGQAQEGYGANRQAPVHLCTRCWRMRILHNGLAPFKYVNELTCRSSDDNDDDDDDDDDDQTCLTGYGFCRLHTLSQSVLVATDDDVELLEKSIEVRAGCECAIPFPHSPILPFVTEDNIGPSDSAL